MPGEPLAGVNDIHTHPAEPFELSVLALSDEDIIAVDDSDERPTLIPEPGR